MKFNPEWTVEFPGMSDSVQPHVEGIREIPSIENLVAWIVAKAIMESTDCAEVLDTLEDAMTRIRRAHSEIWKAQTEYMKVTQKPE